MNLEDKNFIKVMISDKKYFSLKDRFKMIYDEYSDILQPLSKNIGTQKNFTDNNNKIRGKLVHGYEGKYEIDIPDVFWRSKNIQLVLYLCFLTEMGWSNQQIRNIFVTDRISKYIAH